MTGVAIVCHHASTVNGCEATTEIIAAIPWVQDGYVDKMGHSRRVTSTSSIVVFQKIHARDYRKMNHQPVGN